MYIVKGMVGIEVRELQTALVRHGANITVDGGFGEKTEQAVEKFQAENGLKADGIVGNMTAQKLGMIEVVGNTIVVKHQHRFDFETTGVELGVPPEIIYAIVQKESRGSGFTDDGHPKVLFERHWFRKQILKKGYGLLTTIVENARPDLCNESRGGYRGGKAEYTRFLEAYQLNKESAIEACSWGAFQIMGFHWKKLGFESAEDFKAAMCESEQSQFDIFIAFIAADRKLRNAMREYDYDEIARRYNGPKYKENKYDAYLEKYVSEYSG